MFGVATSQQLTGAAQNHHRNVIDPDPGNIHGLRSIFVRDLTVITPTYRRRMSSFDFQSYARRISQGVPLLLISTFKTPAQFGTICFQMFSTKFTN